MILSAYTKGTKEIASTMNKMIDLKYVAMWNPYTSLPIS